MSARKRDGRSASCIFICCFSTLLLHCCYTVVTLLLHCCYTVVTLLLHCRYAVVTLLLQYNYTVVTLLFSVGILHLYLSISRRGKFGCIQLAISSSTEIFLADLL
jgi:hypothetical protein